jgi:AraC family transcriptional regulator
MTPSHLDLISGVQVIQRALPGVVVEYGWLPPFEGEPIVRPNRVKIVFSGHSSVWLHHARSDRKLSVRPGSAYMMNETPTCLRRIADHSETIDLFMDMEFLAREAEAQGHANFVLSATLDRRDVNQLDVDPVFLGLATRFRQACLAPASASLMDLSSLSARLIHHIIVLQTGPRTHGRNRSGLLGRTLHRVADHVEDHLAEPLTIGALADVAGLSTFHFSREFKTATGMSPWQYVATRRIERAKQLLLRTRQSVEEIAWSIGLENVSHFRSQFRRHVGVRPAELRNAVLSS